MYTGNTKVGQFFIKVNMTDRGRLQKYYERDRSYSRDRSPKYYKNDYEREYYNTFQDHGNRRNYKDLFIRTSIGLKISMVVIDLMIWIILMIEIGQMTETGHIVETGTTPENTKETGHTLEIDHMTEMIHIVEIDHETTIEMPIRRIIINIREGLEIIMRTSMRTGMVRINMNANSEMTDMT